MVGPAALGLWLPYGAEHRWRRVGAGNVLLESCTGVAFLSDVL